MKTFIFKIAVFSLWKHRKKVSKKCAGQKRWRWSFFLGGCLVFYNLSRLNDDPLLLNNLSSKLRNKLKSTRLGAKAYTINWLLMWYIRPNIEKICMSVSLLMWYIRPNIENICMSVSLLMWYRRPKIENICTLNWYHAHPELIKTPSV